MSIRVNILDLRNGEWSWYPVDDVYKENSTWLSK